MNRLRNLLESPYSWFGLLALYVAWIDSPPLMLTGDQKLYLSQALEMWDRGDPWHPYFRGEPSYFKPPLQHWLILLSWKIFGVGIGAALLPSAFAVVFTAVLLTWIGRRVSEGATLPTVGLVFATMLGTITYGSVAQMEIFLCAGMAACWAAALKFLGPTLEKRNWAWAYLALALAGTLSWVKSPLYSVLWVTSWVLYLIISGEWEVILHRKFPRTLVFGAVMGSLWFVAMLATDYDRFWQQYFVQETFSKKGGNGGTLTSLWLALALHLAPFSVIAVSGMRLAWRARRTADLLQLFFAWSIPLALFFSLHPYRVTTYLYPLAAPIALIVDWALHRAARRTSIRWSIRAGGVIVSIASLVIASALGRVEWISPGIVSLWVLVGFGVIWPVIVRASRTYLLVSAPIIVLLFRATSAQLGGDDLADLMKWKSEHPQTKISFWEPVHNIWSEAGWLRLVLKTPVEPTASIPDAVATLCQGGALIANELDISHVRAQLSSVLVGQALIETPWSRLKTRREFPFDDLFSLSSNEAAEQTDTFHRNWAIFELGEPCKAAK